MGGASASKCSLEDFRKECAEAMDPARSWTNLGVLEPDESVEPDVPGAVKRWDPFRDCFIEEGSSYKDFKVFIKQLSRNLPTTSGKIAAMIHNANSSDDITLSHQKALHGSMKVTTYSTGFFVALAQRLAALIMTWPGMSKVEAAHFATSTVSAIVGQLETAGGDHGLYSAQEAECTSYEFCLAIGKEHDGDLILQVCEMSMSNTTESWNAFFGVAEGRSEDMTISIDRVTFIK